MVLRFRKDYEEQWSIEFDKVAKITNQDIDFVYSIFEKELMEQWKNESSLIRFEIEMNHTDDFYSDSRRNMYIVVTIPKIDLEEETTIGFRKPKQIQTLNELF